MPETNQNETAIQKSTTVGMQRQPETFAPRTLNEAIKFAELIAKSGMVTKDYAGKPEAIIVAIQMGMEVGLQPLQALQNIAVINGRPAIWGDGAVALVKTHPEFEWIKEDDLEAITKAKKAVCVIKRRGQPEVKMTFSMEDAKQAGLQGKTGPWSTYPNRMLQLRARGFAIRDAFPDALKGIVTVEEAMDYDAVTIPGGPLVEATPQPDPLDGFITPEEAKEIWDLAKANGHVVKTPDEKFNVDGYKKALQEVGHCDRSDKLTKRHYEAMKQFVSKPVNPISSAPAADTTKQQTVDAASVEQGQTDENMDAEPPEESRP